MLLKAGSTQAQDTLNSVIHNNVVCDNDMHYCQWAEPGERYVLHQRGHVPSSLVRAVAVRRHQSHALMLVRSASDGDSDTGIVVSTGRLSIAGTTSAIILFSCVADCVRAPSLVRDESPFLSVWLSNMTEKPNSLVVSGLTTRLDNSGNHP